MNLSMVKNQTIKNLLISIKSVGIILNTTLPYKVRK